MKSDERTWVRIGFDRVPYWIAKELIGKVNFCNGCEEIIDTKQESLESHLLQFHDGDSNVSLKPYFGDILLVPGPGHMEINFLPSSSLRRIFSCLNWLTSWVLGLQRLKILPLIVGIIIYHGRLQILYLMHLQKNWFMFFYNVVSMKIWNQQLKILFPGAIKELLIQILISPTT